MNILLIVICGYMVYNNTKSLLELGAGQWEFVHYLLLVITVLLALVAVWQGWLLYKKGKAPAEDTPPGEEREPGAIYMDSLPDYEDIELEDGEEEDDTQDSP